MKQTVYCAFLCLILAACGKPPAPEVTPEPDNVVSAEALEADTTQLLNFTAAANEFHAFAEQTSKQMLAQCSQMKAAIESFLASPSEQTQLAAQQAFYVCYQGWIASEFYQQHAFDLAEEKSLKTLLDLIDTRPFLPGYIDGIPEYPYSGLIHEMDMPITAGNLRSQHRLMDEDSASVGFPAVEFFLWKSPVATQWAGAETSDVVKRRHTYLSIVSSQLINQLTQTIMRWQPNSNYSLLPERAQLNIVLQSMQRLVMVDLLTKGFENSVVRESEWFHPAILSGRGRDYPILRLTQLQQYISSEAFIEWLTRQTGSPVTVDDLTAAVASSIAAIEALPENYPFDTTETDENWLVARQQIASLTLLLSQLSEHFQIPIVTS